MQQNWPADRVERRAIGSLKPAPRNARTHSDAQVRQIAESMREWGWTVPVLVDEAGAIIAGHGRIAAARLLGLTEVPVMVAEGWTEAQKRAYLLADNQLTLNGAWDLDLLGEELRGLREWDFDLENLGFPDLDALMARGTQGLTDPDEAPEAPQKPVSALGDVWQLGSHRLVCGDCTAPEAVAALMQGRAADLCFTSPPYAQQRDYGSAKEHVQNWDALMQGAFANAPVAPAGQILVNLGLVHRDGEWLPYWEGWIAWMRVQGWRRFGWYVWDQGFGLPGDWNGRLGPSHEFIFHFNRETMRANKTKPKQPDSIYNLNARSHTMRGKDGKLKEFVSPKSGENTHKIPDSVIRVLRHQGRIEGNVGSHPAVFPVGLPQEIIKAFSKPDGRVFDPFVGSGTTIIAAEMTGRVCHAIELDPAYVDVAVRRWENFTGQKAMLDGQTFDDVAAERVKAAA